MGFAIFLVYVFLSFFRPFELFWPDLAELRPMLVLWVLGMVFSGGRALVKKQVGARRIDFLLLLALVLAIAASLLVKGWFGGAMTAISDFSISSMLFVLVALNVTDWKRLRMTCATVILAMLTTALMGINAYHTGFLADKLVMRQNAPGYEEMEPDPEAVAPAPGTPRNARPPDQIPAQDKSGRYLWRVRGQAYLNDPNDFSQVLVMCLPILWIFWREKSFLRNLFVVLLPASVMVYGIVLSQSRGALLGTAAALFFVVKRRIGTVMTFALMGLGGTAFLAASVIGGRAMSSKEQSAADRIEAWSVGLDLLKSNPVLGAGFNNFMEHHWLTAHNSFVLCFAELGLVGFFIWIGMIVLTFKSLTAAIDTLPLRSPNHQAVFLLRNSLVGFLVCAWFLSRTYQPILYFLLALCVSAWYCASTSPGMTDPQSEAYKKIRGVKWVKSTIFFMIFVLVAVRIFVFSHFSGGGG